MTPWVEKQKRREKQEKHMYIFRSLESFLFVMGEENASLANSPDRMKDA